MTPVACNIVPSGKDSSVSVWFMYWCTLQISRSVPAVYRSALSIDSISVSPLASRHHFTLRIAGLLEEQCSATDGGLLRDPLQQLSVRVDLRLYLPMSPGARKGTSLCTDNRCRRRVPRPPIQHCKRHDSTGRILYCPCVTKCVSGRWSSVNSRWLQFSSINAAQYTSSRVHNLYYTSITSLVYSGLQR